ncbi:hypothetical protein FNV43_RR23092 [Rhamnella rubrinervis]|uniref:Uncharacterized protein n=1 Tax=Rhamnella rubrinervis TaxID=2594499 RepID=A0A8K0GVQ4_9ROSA|nr:hypothetical protein FNV43_RR23092 [Rhamnella rubrinervis]
MSSGASVSASAHSPVCYSLQSKPKTSHDFSASTLVYPRTVISSDLKLKGLRFSTTKGSHRRKLLCRSSNRPGDAGSGDSESRSVLDAFFLGKALAEALNERVESAVGELLSTIGRLQSEQQKQVLDFQEEVLQRAKSAKEKAAREALEARGLTAKPISASTRPVTVTNGVSSSVSPSPTSDDSIDQSSPSDETPSTVTARPDIVNDQDSQDPFSGY